MIITESIFDIPDDELQNSNDIEEPETLVKEITYPIKVMIFFDCMCMSDDSKKFFILPDSVMDKILKATNYILNFSHLVTNFSTPIFTTTDEYHIKHSNIIQQRTDTSFAGLIPQYKVLEFTLETKTLHNNQKDINRLFKFYYSFYILQKIFDNYHKQEFSIEEPPYIKIGAYSYTPHRKVMNLLSIYPDRVTSTIQQELKHMFITYDD